jgi:AhpD family alkylhydroperoxidase
MDDSMFDAGQGGASRGVLTICIGLRFPQQEKAPETMTKDFPAITKRISDDIKKLRKDIPDTLNGFSALANAALRGGALDKKTKELVALALGVAAHCDGCIGFHAETLVKLGASRQEIEEALGMAGPALMYAADAIAAFEQFYELANTEAIED